MKYRDNYNKLLGELWRWESDRICNPSTEENYQRLKNCKNMKEVIKMELQPQAHFEQNFDMACLNREKICKDFWAKLRRDNRKILEA